MRRYLIKRISYFIPMLILITFISYAVMEMAPGDPALAWVDLERMKVTPELLDQIRANLGLNSPFYIRYIKWLWQILQGNWGYSMVTHRSVLWEIGNRANITILISGISMMFSMVTGIVFGVIAALKKHKWQDNALLTLNYLNISIPSMWLALMLITLFTVQLGWLPSIGLHDMSLYNPTKWEYFVDSVKHLILPLICMSINGIGSWTLYQRAAFIEEKNLDYVRTARSKGVSEHNINFRHVLRNASLPTITSLGGMIPTLFTGSALIETTFGIPGLGAVAVSSLTQRDYSMSMAVILATSLLTLIGMLVSDILYAVVDPRVRY